MKKLLLTFSYLFLLSTKANVYIKTFINSSPEGPNSTIYEKLNEKQTLLPVYLLNAQKNLGLNGNIGIELRYGNKTSYIAQVNLGVPGNFSFSLLGINYNVTENNNICLSISHFINKTKNTTFTTGTFLQIRYSRNIEKYDFEIFASPYITGNFLTGIMGSIGIMKKI